MIYKAFISLLVLFAFATVCLAKDKPPITDDSIYDQVRLRLANDQVVKGGGLQVDVKQGVVTIKGEVEKENQKERATKLAKKVKGVKEVVNNITLRGQTAGR
ncbi:MAG: BON domain-containing protein [Acidobacteriia bacterium]|nr:BON domain-containing protein [Terriglobia bacterium]